MAGVRLMQALTGNLQEGLETGELARTPEDLVAQIRVLAALAVLQSGASGIQPAQVIPSRSDMPGLRGRAIRQFVLAELETGNVGAASALAETIPDASIGKEMRDQVAPLQQQVDLRVQAEGHIRAGNFQDALAAAKLVEDASGPYSAP